MKTKALYVCLNLLNLNFSKVKKMEINFITQVFESAVLELNIKINTFKKHI